MSSFAKAVVFDVGRVLFHWNLRTLFAKLIDDPVELDWFLTEVVSEGWHFQHDRGVPLSEMLPARIAQFPDQALRIAAYAARFNETAHPPVEGVHELVGRLHADAVPLFCLTNFGDELFAQFRAEHAIFDLFEDIIVSGEEKIAKPDQRIYQLVEQRSGFAASELFFTDDNAANIKAARERDWDAHLFTDANSLESQLQRAGLLRS